MTLSETRRTKIIILLLLLISTIFVLGCSTHGKEDEEDVRYEFCPGKCFWSSGEAHNMIYYAVNQSSVTGAVKDPYDELVSDSGFESPVNVADDNGGMWVADGFVEEKNPSEYKFEEGIYTLYFKTKSESYETKREMNWYNFPTWKDTATFYTDSANSSSREIKVLFAGITSDENTKQYSIQYRLKVYVAESRASRLFGQSKAQGDSTEIRYSLPRVSSSIKLVPVLVCEMYQNNKIQKILYYPGKEFPYNP